MKNEELSFAGAAPTLPLLANSVQVPKQPAIHLTPRESEVVRFVMLGESNKQIARRLGISNYTVRDHVSNLLKKTGVTSRSRLSLVLPAPIVAASSFAATVRAVPPIGGARGTGGDAVHDAGVDRPQTSRPWGK